MLIELIDTVIDLLTLRRVWKRPPLEIESEMKRAYAESEEGKKLDALEKAAAKHPAH